MTFLILSRIFPFICIQGSSFPGVHHINSLLIFESWSRHQKQQNILICHMRSVDADMSLKNILFLTLTFFKLFYKRTPSKKFVCFKLNILCKEAIIKKLFTCPFLIQCLNICFNVREIDLVFKVALSLFHIHYK